jgi:hypothetical protein
LFLLALVPRLAILLLANPQAIETWEYENLARSIAAGQGYAIVHWGRLSFGFGDGNLYTFLAGALYVLLGHQPMLLAVVQAFVASLAAPVILTIGQRALGTSVATLGATLAALHPGLLAYTLKLHPLGVDVLLLSLLVLWIGRLDGRPREGFITGIALGMTLMSRPTFFLAGLVGLSLRWRTLRRHLVPSVIAVIVALAVATPWIGRNWIVLGRPVFITTSLEDVWKGNNPAATGSSYLASGHDVFTAMPTEMRTRLQAATELEMNDVFGSEILTFVREQPQQFVSLVVQKFFYFWWFSPQSGLFYPSLWLILYQVYEAFVLGFALIGSAWLVRAGSRDGRQLLGLLVAVSLTIAAVHALTYVEGRHRWGVEPLLLLLTAQGIFFCAGYLRVLRRASNTPLQIKNPTSNSE